MRVITNDGIVIPGVEWDDADIKIASFVKEYRDYRGHFGAVLKLIRDGSWDDAYMAALGAVGQKGMALQAAFGARNMDAVDGIVTRLVLPADTQVLRSAINSGYWSDSIKRKIQQYKRRVPTLVNELLMDAIQSGNPGIRELRSL